MTYIARRLAAFARKDSGTVSVIFGLTILTVIAAIGVGIDFARAVHARSQLQQALDAAVLAGARTDAGEQIGAATTMFNTNFSDASAKNVASSFSPISEVEFAGTATAQVDTTLAAMLGIETMNIKAVSRAKGIGGGVEHSACVLVLDKTAAQAFLVNSGPVLKAPDCELHVKSTGNPAVIFNAGSDIDTKRICLAAPTNKIIDNGGHHPNLEKACTTAEDPFAGKLTEPSSTSGNCSNVSKSGTVTMQPGVYCGGINFNSNTKVTFSPGTYVIKGGDWNVNGGTWTGTGVTFFFADTSKIQFNSGVAATITAPTSGPYKDIVMFEKAGLQRSPFVFDDSKNMDLRGAIYLPSRDVIFNNKSNLASETNKKMTIIVNTLILNQTKWNLSPPDELILSGGVKSLHLIQ